MCDLVFNDSEGGFEYDEFSDRIDKIVFVNRFLRFVIVGRVNYTECLTRTIVDSTFGTNYFLLFTFGTTF